MMIPSVNRLTRQRTLSIHRAVLIVIGILFSPVKPIIKAEEVMGSSSAFSSSTLNFAARTTTQDSLRSSTTGVDPSADDVNTATAKHQSLNMTICTGKCVGDCKTYITPLNKCYSSGKLFPNDPSWSGLDISDRTIFDDTMLLRTIYAHSSNGSCLPSKDDDDDDRFQIDLNVCVGPFGKPRPWGIFSIVQDLNNDENDKIH